jgi:alpha-L-arabinofuranosidase
VTEATDSTTRTEPVHATASREDATGDVILKVVNVSGAPQLLRVELEGARGLAPSAGLEVLTGDPLEENSLDAPMRVSPTTRTVRVAGTTFEHAFPANSFTVMRLGTR